MPFLGAIAVLASDVGWALLHSIWQIGLVAAGFAVLDRLLPHRSAQARYLVGCTALLLMVAIPIVSVGTITSERMWTGMDGDPPAARAADMEMNRGGASRGSLTASQTELATRRLDSPVSRNTFLTHLDHTTANSALSPSSFVPVHIVTYSWIVGVVLLSFRPICGLILAKQVRMTGRSAVPRSIEALLGRLARRMHIRSVAVSQSTIANVPCVVGWFRPLILLPLSTVSGLTTSELESILVHELAHIRRHDYLVNLAQSIIETLLFYHPAVWWVSHRIRIEREHCCDDFVVQILGDRSAYTTALLAVGAAATGPSFAIAADGSVLFQRIQRILSVQNHLSSNPAGSGRALVAAACCVVALSLAMVAACNRTVPNEGGSNSDENLNMDHDMGADVGNNDVGNNDAGNNFKATPAGICEAARSGDVDTIERMLADKPGLIAIDNPHNWTKTVDGHDVSGSFNKKPVEVAAFFGQSTAVSKLLEISRSSSAIDDPIGGYFNSLSIARVMGHEDVLSAIEDDVMARVDAHPELLRNSGERKDTLLFYAAQQGHMPLVRKLLDRGADATSVSNIGHTVIQTVLNGSKDEERREIARLLIQRSAPVTLWVATAMEDVERIKSMLAADPSLAREHWQWSECYPLVRACQLGNRQIIELLLDHGADVNADTGLDDPPDFGMPIMQAMYAGRYDLVNLLLDRGASIQAHPNCDTPFVDLLYMRAGEAFPEHFTWDDVPDDAGEVVKLHYRVKALGGEPHMYSHVKAKNHREIARLLSEHAEAEAWNYGRGPGTVFDALAHAAAWLGDAETMELCLRSQPQLLTPERANENLRDAIRSHNREGSFTAYRRIIEMNLDALKKRNAPLTIQPLQLLATSFLHNYRYSSNPELPVMPELLALAELFIEHGVSIDERDPESNHTPLSLAVSEGHTEYVGFLLERGASTNQSDPAETRPMTLAEERGFREIVELLDASMNKWRISEWQRAIESDDVEAVEQLLKRDRTYVRQCVQKFRQDGTWFLVDPLCEAARRNCIPVTKLILDHERGPNVTFGQGQWNGEVSGAHCLAWAASEQMRQVLTENGADPCTIEGVRVPHLQDETVPLEQTTGDLGMQWQLAIESRDEERVRDLLKRYPYLSRQVIMERWRDGRMGHRSLDPLYQCAQSGHLNIVKWMIEAGYEKSRLEGAFELAAPEVAAFLLDQGVEAKPNIGLMAYIGQHEAVKFWLDRGYEVQPQMLHDACCGRGRLRGHKFDGRKGWPESFRETVRVLIEAGADVNERNASGNTKYEGCKPWVSNRETPLHYAAGNWDPELVQLLLDAGADKTLANDLGETPYDWAVRYEAPAETLALLTNQGEEQPTVISTNKLSPESRPHDISVAAWQVFCAAANGDIETLRQRIKLDPALIHTQLWYEFPLHYAVRGGNADCVRLLLEAGSNPARSNFTYSSWQAILPIAKDRGFDEIHALLIAAMQRRFNYDPSYKPLWEAIVTNNPDKIEQLIGEHPDLVNVSDEHGNRAIHWAVLARRIPIIQLLLDSGADVNARRADHQSPLHLSIVGDYWFGKTNQHSETTSGEVTQFLLDAGASYEFSAAVSLGDLEHVKSELATQPELASRLNDSLRSPLFLAARRGHLEIVRLLLAHGADPNHPEECAGRGRALFEASCREDIPMMKLLLAHGADADAYVDSSGNCLSNVANEEAAALLKENGALPGEWELDTPEKISAALNDKSFVPERDLWSGVLGSILKIDQVELLEQFVRRFGNEAIRGMNPTNGWRVPRSEAMLTALLKHGLNINARDWYGRSFLHHVAGESPDRGVHLVKHGIDVNAIDHQSGTTALGIAAWAGNLAMVNFLLESGADPSLPNNAEWATPLAFAEQQGHEEVVRRLRDAT